MSGPHNTSVALEPAVIHAEACRSDSGRQGNRAQEEMFRRQVKPETRDKSTVSICLLGPE